MKPCKAKPTDGKPCPNQVDEGLEYCFYHLAKQDAELKKKLLAAGKVLGVVAAFGYFKFGPKALPKAFENIIASFLPKKQ